VREAQRLDVFLKTGRYLAVIPPETVADEFWTHHSKDGVRFGELFATTGGGAERKRAVIGAVLEDDAVEEKYCFFGDVSYISAGLGMNF